MNHIDLTFHIHKKEMLYLEDKVYIGINENMNDLRVFYWHFVDYILQ